MFQVNPLLGRVFTLKNQAFFSLKDKSKKLKCRLLQFLFGALRVNETDAEANTDADTRVTIMALLYFHTGKLKRTHYTLYAPTL